MTEDAPHPIPWLFDEHTRPDFRDVYGRLLRSSDRLDVALTHIRLSTLDLGAAELEHVRSIRLLLAQVSASHLDAEAHAVALRSDKRAILGTLAAGLARGVIQVRSAPLGGWSPDFSLFRGPGGPIAVLLGFHWFERPFPYRGPAFGSVHGPDAARRALPRFEESWARAHDIGAAVLGIIGRAERAESRCAATAAGPPE